jgi:hypothetical protein
MGYFETVTLLRLHEFTCRVERLELELGLFSLKYFFGSLVRDLK